MDCLLKYNAELLTHDLRTHEPLNLTLSFPAKTFCGRRHHKIHIKFIIITSYDFWCFVACKETFFDQIPPRQTVYPKRLCGLASNAYLKTPTIRNWLWYTNIRFRICAYFKKSLILRYFGFHFKYMPVPEIDSRDKIRIGQNEVKQTHQSLYFAFWFLNCVDF